MTGGKRLSVNINKIRAMAAALAVLLCLVMLTGCNSMNEAEKKVSKELKAMQDSGNIGSEVMDLRNSLSDEGRENFDGFIKKLRSFDFEITGSEESKDQDDDSTLVSVKIKTFDFGREYLAVWTEFLKSNEEEYIKTIKIVCIDPLGNGEWIANIKDNEELQDAVFGGMMSEMKTLAAE